jgi:glycosyltransferase involved in cell wall biosynthesis
VKIQSLTLDYPPRRFIGSEVMTHRLLDSLADAGHFVRASTISSEPNPGYDGISVTPLEQLDDEWADAYLVHAEIAAPILRLHKPVIAICHNLETAVLVSLRRNNFDLVIANSLTMQAELAELDIESIVVHPPAIKSGMVLAGDLVTIVNLNENKVGRFWEIAAAMPEQGFLAVLGGYGEQIIPDQIPGNVEIIDHVRSHRMVEKVWGLSRLLLAPSARESWNMTAGEAIAYGIPVLATDHPGVRENLGRSATYLPVGDVDAWVEEIRMAAEPNESIQQQAILNRRRYDADLHYFAKAVGTLGDDHRQTV